jgi:demethylmenaquinone methyltransferase/2-methoxy-6-polyprenyl-1,4-benzoquinol methylase
MPAYYQKTYEKWYSWFSHIYDSFAKIFCFIFNGGFGGERRWREKLVEWIDPQSEEKIIDICSGTGTLTIMLASKLSGKGKVVGIELSPAQLNVARKKKKPDDLIFIEADAQNIPFENGYFDKGVICGALHEMPQVVRLNVLRATYNVIRPGGKVVIFEHNEPKSRWKAWLLDLMERLNPEYPTYKDMLKSGLKNEIEQVGFRIIKTDVTIWEFFKLFLTKK